MARGGHYRLDVGTDVPAAPSASGQMAGNALAAELHARATLDVHAADQMSIFLALAHGESRFRVRELSSHARTAMWLLARFGTTGSAVEAEGRLVRVRPRT